MRTTLRARSSNVFERHSRAADEPGFPQHLPVAERRARTLRALAARRRRGEALAPVEVAGRTIAQGPLGRAWCKRVDALPGMGTRLAGGRSYVRSGSVIDLRVEPGLVRALVQGTALYSVELRFEPRAQPARFVAPGTFVASCSCPDEAPVCKHAAAALYAVGARLDAEPEIARVLRAGATLAE